MSRRTPAAAALVAVAGSLTVAPPPASAQEQRQACSTTLSARPCLTVTNRRRGTVFDFVTRRGSLGGRIHVGQGGPQRRPFTTNATGVATGLNADQLDGLDAEDIFRLSRQGVINLIRANFDPDAFLRAAGKAADSDLLDGLDATAFLPVRGKAADSEQLDGKDSTAFLGATAKAADADELDGLDSSELFPTSRTLDVAGGGRLQLNHGDNGEVFDDFGLRVEMRCVDTGGGDTGIELELDTDENNTVAYAEGGGVTGPPVVVNAAGTGTLFELDETQAPTLATIEVTIAKPDGVDVTGLLAAGFAIHGNDCLLSGTLLKTP